MRNESDWTPSKFVLRGDRLVASRNPEEVGLGSRFIGDIQGAVYQRLISAHAKGRLADLGCGKCPLYVVYKPLVTEAICVDWPGSLHTSPFLDLAADLNEPLKLETAAFDTVLMTDVLEHIRNPAALMSEIARILRPKGRLLLTVPFLYWIHEQPYDYFRYTRYALSEFCRTADLEVVELAEYGGAPEVLLDIVGKQLARSDRLAEIYSPLASWLAERRFAKRISRNTQDKFPLGYSLVASKRET